MGRLISNFQYKVMEEEGILFYFINTYLLNKTMKLELKIYKILNLRTTIPGIHHWFHIIKFILFY